MRGPDATRSPGRGPGWLRSALTEESRFRSTPEVLAWLEERAQASTFRVERIPFAALDQWHFEERTGDLVHRTGGFFRVEGLRVRTNFGPVREWQQPIINQPEIGILGIICRTFDGIPYFLMQAKMEPGNANVVQLSPTVQATRSNFSRVHRGRLPDYLEYFLDRSRSRVVVDLLQAEQGTRFLRKRNRNMIVEVQQDVPLRDDFCWLTLGQVKRLAAVPNLVNMDSRSVLSNVRLMDGAEDGRQGAELLAEVLAAEPFAGTIDSFERDLLVSQSEHGQALHSIDEVLSWITEMKVRWELQTEYVPLGSLTGWTRDAQGIRDDGGSFFEVLAVAVRAGNREVAAWTQPLLQSRRPGLTGVLARKIRGVLHFLMQARVEPGFRDTVEITPTVTCGQCVDAPAQAPPPPFLELFERPGPQRVRYSAVQSLEGGRFYQDQNTYQVVELPADAELAIPDNYMWLTLQQLKDLLRHNTVIAIDTRELLACLSL